MIISNNRLLLACNCFFAAMLASPLVPGLNRYFANIYLCTGVILLLVFLNYRMAKAIGCFALAENVSMLNEQCRKSKSRILAWAILAAAVTLVGIGPVVSPSAYSVDSFTRVFGMGVTDDYSVSKKVNYFYCAAIVFGLLLFCFYHSIRFALLNNLNNKTKRLSGFSDTMLFVGYSFLLVCAYRQFSFQYSYDLTAFLLKSVFIFAIPLFYFWQTGKLNVYDVRLALAFLFFSLVFSIDVILYLGTSTAKFNSVLAIVFVTSSVFFCLNKKFNFLNCRKLYSKIMVMALIGSFSIILFSLSLEFSNILAYKTGKFLDLREIYYILLGIICTFGYYWVVKKDISKHTVNLSLFVFVLASSLIQLQPSLIISSEFDTFETANYAVPVSDFLNFGKIPFFENFPGHGLSGVISSIAYGLLTGDYHDALFAPWRNWLYCSLCTIALYFFTKRVANGLIAVSVSILLPYFVFPYLHSFTSFSGVGLLAVVPFVLYLKTFRKKYLILTVILTILVLFYKLDIGYAFLVGIIGSSLCVSAFYKKMVIIDRVLLFFIITGAVAFTIFLSVCLIKDINPVSRIQEFLSIVSSNDHWGYNGLGDTEKNSYAFVYYVVPLVSVVCFLFTIIFRSRLNTGEFAVSLCLIFAYFANIPRFLVMHSLMQYVDYFVAIWMWTIPFALPFLASRLLSSRSAYILCQTFFVILVYVFFQGTTYYNNSPLQNVVSSAERLSAQLCPENREKDINFVFNRGSRVVVDGSSFFAPYSHHMFHAMEIRAVADLLLSPDETYLDFSTMSAAYAISQRENPVYVVQSPSALSGERSQRAFIREIEARLDNVPIAIMPANENWPFILQQDWNSNNLWHYLVAEWIYKNYRPLFKYNDFASVWVQHSRYDEFYKRLNNQDFLTSRNVFLNNPEPNTRLKEGQSAYCHDCKVKMTKAGLRILPTGPDPFLVGLGKLIGTEDLESSNYLTLYLAKDNKADFQLFWMNEKSEKFTEQDSVHALSISPRIVTFDLEGLHQSASHTRLLRLDVPDHGSTIIQSVSVGNSFPMRLSFIDWGYDNFISLPEGKSPTADYISNAHDYSLRFLPYIWGQFDSKNASGNADLTNVRANGELYSWNCSGHESKPAYLRVDLSVDKEFLQSKPKSYLILGNMEGGKFIPLNRFKFSLKEGKKVYLFRISADYYWSRGMLSTLLLDPDLADAVTSVRILEGD